MNKIYIIEEYSGQYEDFFANQLFYFTDKEEAEKYLILIKEETLRINLLAQEFWQREEEYYNSISNLNESPDEEITKGFTEEILKLEHKYIKNHRPEQYDNYGYGIKEISQFFKE